MDCIETGTYRSNDSSTETHKKFSDTLRQMKGKVLKSILTYLRCTKYNCSAL